MTTTITFLAVLIGWAIAIAVLLRVPRTTGVLLIVAHICGAWDYWAHGRPMCATWFAVEGVLLGGCILYVDAVTGRRRRAAAA